MTLVVGCATPEIGFMIADTLLSSEYVLRGKPGPINGMHHALKVQILNGSTAVAFAGDPAQANELISGLNDQLAKEPGSNVVEYLSNGYTAALERATKGLEPDCEFLVLQIKPDGKKLTHVTRSGIIQCERAYIGDPEAYKRLMGLRKPYEPPAVQHVQQPDGSFREEALVLSNGEIEFAEVSNALDALCHERTSRSVGAISNGITRVVDARISGEFEYLQLGEASVTLEESASGYSLLASNTGRRGIALYFRAGGMGFLFAVGDPEGCRKEYAETIELFVEQAKDRFGLDLTGVSWVDQSTSENAVARAKGR
jgi:hypothetical protein